MLLYVILNNITLITCTMTRNGFGTHGFRKTVAVGTGFVGYGCGLPKKTPGLPVTIPICVCVPHPVANLFLPILKGYGPRQLINL